MARAPEGVKGAGLPGTSADERRTGGRGAFSALLVEPSSTFYSDEIGGKSNRRVNHATYLPS